MACPRLSRDLPRIADRVRILRAVLLLPLVAMAAPHHQAGSNPVLAPGYSRLDFEAPAAGSYRLPPIRPAANGRVLDDRGNPHALHDLMGDKLVVLSFIYTNCSDVNGCPLATFVLKKVQDRVRQDKALAENVRLVSISFDRVNDTPQVLHEYAAKFRDRDFDWQFLTTPGDDALASILRDYDQFVIRDVNEAGETTGSLSHILRVVLIDRSKRVRNIYSVSFLHPDIIVNDILTIAGD